jgi:hypothetical protein
LLNQAVTRRVDQTLIEHIRDERTRLRSRRAQLARFSLGGLAPAAEYRNASARIGQRGRDAATEDAVSTGDDCDFPLEREQIPDGHGQVRKVI